MSAARSPNTISRRSELAASTRSCNRAGLQSVSAMRAPKLAFTLLLVLFSTEAMLAAPLANYKSRVDWALIELGDLAEELEHSGGRVRTGRIEKVFNDVRETLPPEETIQWEGGSVRVDNSWLSDELNNYLRMPPSDARRDAVLSQIVQRLLAHSDRMAELMVETARTDKAAEKTHLGNILRRDEFSEKPPEKNIFERMWERIKNWWNNLFPGTGSLQPGQTSWLSFIAMLLVFALSAAVVAFVIWKLLPYLRRKSAGLRLEKRGARIVLGEHLAADKTAADLLNEAEALARKGELRAAIRKGYIAILLELGDRKVITLAQHKTNHDYLRAVREQRPLLNEMQKLTNSFENHWYGFIPATASDWAAFRTGYQRTLKTASLLSDK